MVSSIPLRIILGFTTKSLLLLVLLTVFFGSICTAQPTSQQPKPTPIQKISTNSPLNEELNEEETPNKNAAYSSTFKASDGKEIEYGFTKADIPWLILCPLVILGILVLVLYYYLKNSNLLADPDIAVDVKELPVATGTGSSWIQDQVREALEAGNTKELIITKHRPPAEPLPVQSPAESNNAELESQDNGLQSLDLEEDHPIPAIIPPPIPLSPAKTNPVKPWNSMEEYLQFARSQGQLKKFLGEFSLPVQPNGQRFTTPNGETALVLPRLEAPDTLLHALQENDVLIVFHQGSILTIKNRV